VWPLHDEFVWRGRGAHFSMIRGLMFRWLSLSAAIVLADQLSKAWITARYQLFDSEPMTSLSYLS
jgi:lipoprotein signal peptidase